jgi:hypothetical protein
VLPANCHRIPRTQVPLCARLAANLQLSLKKAMQRAVDGVTHSSKACHKDFRYE